MNRLNQLMKLLLESDEDQLLLTDDSTISYLLDYSISTGERFTGLLIGRDQSVRLFCNQLFPLPSLPLVQVIRWNDAENPLQLLEPYIQDYVGVDPAFPSRLLLPLIAAKPQSRFVVTDLANQLRAEKAPEEIDLLRQASSINDQIMNELVTYIDGSQTELEIAAIIASLHKKHHVEASFPPIVAFGDHAADPHAVPSERMVQPGEVILVDMGCRYQGYCSDMTRTFFFEYCEHPSWYALVLQANQNAINAIQPQQTFATIDQAARGVFIQANLGHAFIHRTGHGIGREVHEPYDVSATNCASLQPGMVFSIEPGLYLPGKIGIRIEDLVVVTHQGVEVLNRFPKNIIILKKKGG